MNTEQLKRLEELRAKSELTAEENIELSELVALEADAKGNDPVEESATTEENALTENEAKALVVDAVTEGNADLKKAVDSLKNADTEEIAEAVAEKAKSTEDELVEKIGEKVAEENSKALTAEKVQAIVEKAVAKSDAGLTEEGVKTLIETSIANIQGETKMKEDTSEAAQISIPVGNSKGNLPVHQKQLLNILTGEAQDAEIPESLLQSASAKGKQIASRVQQGYKAGLDASSNSEIVDTDLSSNLLVRLYGDSLLMQAFAGQEIQMPTNPFKLPVATSRPTFAPTAELGTPSSSAQGTSQVTLDAEKLVGYVEYSYEVDEDAIVAILPMVEAQLASAAANALEDQLINGAESGILDNGQPVANYIFDGLRKYAKGAQSHCQIDIGAAGITAGNITVLRKAMKQYGMRPEDLCLICGYEGYGDLVALTATLTDDVYGGGEARIRTGTAASVFGIDIIPSAVVAENIGSDGSNGAATETQGQILLVHKPSFVIGTRKGFTVETDVDRVNQKNLVIASFRRDFKALETTSEDIPNVVHGINIDTSATETD
ncbi:MAG: phage major capsid protein [Legionellales bacterium]|nr:phage major capsid protein [Legionellales bacterium]